MNQYVFSLCMCLLRHLFYWQSLHLSLKRNREKKKIYNFFTLRKFLFFVFWTFFCVFFSFFLAHKQFNKNRTTLFYLKIHLKYDIWWWLLCLCSMSSHWRPDCIKIYNFVCIYIGHIFKITPICVISTLLMKKKPSEF